MEKFVFNEISDLARLNNRQRGQIGELAFMRKAASLGLSFAKPWNEGERYDFIARVDTICWRVQVKSVSSKSVSRSHYRIKTTGRNGPLKQAPYSVNEIDFLVAYIHPEDIWYVFPSKIIEARKSLCVRPGSKRSRFEEYREAWKLMKPISAETRSAEVKPAENAPAETVLAAKEKAAGT